MRLFNLIIFLFCVWFTHVIYLFITHGKSSAEIHSEIQVNGVGGQHLQPQAKVNNDLINQAKEDAKSVEKLILAFQNPLENKKQTEENIMKKTDKASRKTSNQKKFDSHIKDQNKETDQLLNNGNNKENDEEDSNVTVINDLGKKDMDTTPILSPSSSTSKNCLNIYLDDGYGVIPDTYLNMNEKDTINYKIVYGDLCQAKEQCQHDRKCSGFVWRAYEQKAEFFGGKIPDQSKWIENKTWISTDLASASSSSSTLRTKVKSNKEPIRNEYPPIRPILDSDHQTSNILNHKKRKKKFDPDQRKKELKQLAQMLASQFQKAQIDLPPVLYVKLSFKDTLTQMLERYDQRPHFQQLISGTAVAPKQEALLRNGVNGSVVSGSGLPGHPRVEYDVLRTAGEWWADFTKAETIDGGICAVKAACAADIECDGFIYRIRDGAGLLGKNFKILEAKSQALRNKLPKFEKKTPRGVLLYMRRPRPLVLGSNHFIGGVRVSKPVRREVSLKQPVTVSSVCWDYSSYTSPPRSDFLRRDNDPEVSLLKKVKGIVTAYRSPDAVTSNVVKALISSSSWALTTPQPKKPLKTVAQSFSTTIQTRKRNLIQDKVWISLTTLPGRIHQIERVLESLVTQTIPADEVVISIPNHSDREGSSYPIPDWLHNMTLRTELPLVRVRRIEHDYGPATKLIPSVMEAQELGENVLILVVDDDTLYSARLLESFLEWHLRLPDAALAFSGWPVTLKTLKYPHWSENYLVYANEVFAPHPVSVIRGNCGYMVQSQFFDKFLWSGFSSAPPGAFFMDDVWISGNLAKNKVKRFVVPFDEDQFTMTPNFENVTTLDHVTLNKPSAHTIRLQGGKPEEVEPDEKKKIDKKGPPSNRVQANEQALRHFKLDWDVFWDAKNYRIVPGR